MQIAKKTVFFLIFLIFGGSAGLFADDAASHDAFQKGSEKEGKAEYLSAADWYDEAQVQADDPVLKANALMSAARCSRKAEQYGKEFDYLQKLAKGHPGRISYTAVVQRQYEIANLYYGGHRDYFVSWLPFIRKDDRTTEILAAVLENAPCAELAPELRLRLGRIYLDDQKPNEAAAEFIKTMKLYPDSQEAKYAALELSNTLLQQAKYGDGDGHFAREATEAFDSFLKKHPEAREKEWVLRARAQLDSYVATRLCKTGDHYLKEGNKTAAARYYADVLRNYGKTKEAVSAEKKLASIDHDFQTTGREWTPQEREFVIRTLPAEPSYTIMTPAESDGRWLLPVRNIRASVMSEQPKQLPEELDKDAL